MPVDTMFVYPVDTNLASYDFPKKDYSHREAAVYHEILNVVMHPGMADVLYAIMMKEFGRMLEVNANHP